MNASQQMSEREAQLEELGVSVSDLVRETGISDKTVRKILRAGEGRPNNIRLVDEALARMAMRRQIGELEPIPFTDSPYDLVADGNLIEFKVARGNDMTVVVRGSVANRDELAETVAALIKKMNDD